MVLIGLAGGVVGYLSSGYGLGYFLYDLVNSLDSFLGQHSLGVMISGIAGTAVLAWALYFIGKAQVNRQLKNEDEDIKDVTLGFSMLVNSWTIMIGMVMFLIFARSLMNDRYALKDFNVAMGVFIVGFLQTFVLSHKSVGFLKKYNPEKYVNTLDVKFRKKFMDSLDEREQLEVYRAAFKTQQLMLNIIFFLVLMAGIIAVDGNSSVVPMITLGILYILSNTIYTIYSSKKNK